MATLSLLLAMDEPPPTELAQVSFSADGKYALAESRWVLDGPGFPVARVEVFELSTGKHRFDQQVELREAAAGAGLEGASAAARERYAAELLAFGLPGVAAMPMGCDDGRCGGQGGCRPTGILVQVEAQPTTNTVCPENWIGQTPTIKVDGQPVPLDTSLAACARNFQPSLFYRAPKGGVLVLNYDIPGHEGKTTRFLTLAASQP